MIFLKVLAVVLDWHSFCLDTSFTLKRNTILSTVLRRISKPVGRKKNTQRKWNDRVCCWYSSAYHRCCTYSVCLINSSLSNLL